MANLLLVEDNADLAYGLRNNLEIEGHCVETVESGEAALDHVRTRRPDLVVLDLSEIWTREGGALQAS